MLLTNKLNLPEAIVAAVANDDYTKGNADFSVTELLAPPQLVYLRNKHDAELSEDVSDRIWSLLGQAVHSIIERASAQLPNLLTETTLRLPFNGYIIKGTADNIAIDTNTLYDFKVTSVYKIKNNPRPPEWVDQTNIYAYMFRKLHGLHLERINILAILRDWSKHEAARSIDYPQTQVITIPIPLWDDSSVEGLLSNSIREHVAARTSGEPRPCTADETWERPTKYAVMKEGRTTAVRVLSTLDEAEQMVADKGPKHYVEVRNGESVRCASYCPVSAFCPQWAANPNKPAESVSLFS